MPKHIPKAYNCILWSSYA